MNTLDDDLEGLETAEDFLTFFGVPFEQRVVSVNRLHILKRFHDYMGAQTDFDGLDDAARRARCHGLIAQAYQDFVVSDAITEKVFKVHRDQAARQAAGFVSLDSLLVGDSLRTGADTEPRVLRGGW